MDESTRNEIVWQRQAGQSIRQIAQALGTTRRTVKRVLDGVQGARPGQESLTAAKPATRRPSQLDA